MLKKGLVIAAAVVGSLVLAGCASQGAGAACGDTTATPVAAPAPVNTCKNMSSCKHKMKKHHHVKKAAKKAAASADASSTTTTSSN